MNKLLVALIAGAFASVAAAQTAPAKPTAQERQADVKAATQAGSGSSASTQATAEQQKANVKASKETAKMSTADKNAAIKASNKAMVNPDNPSGSVAGDGRFAEGERRRVEGHAEGERRTEDEGRPEGPRQGPEGEVDAVIVIPTAVRKGRALAPCLFSLRRAEGVDAGLRQGLGDAPICELPRPCSNAVPACAKVAAKEVRQSASDDRP